MSDHAFLHDGTTMRDLGTLGSTTSIAFGINSSGQAVGWSEIRGGSDFDIHAFVHDGDRMRDVNRMIAPGSGWELTAAHDINDRGQITGVGSFNGEDRAFLLTPTDTPRPVPEPTTMLLLGTGLAGIRAAVRKRR